MRIDKLVREVFDNLFDTPDAQKSQTKHEVQLSCDAGSRKEFFRIYSYVIRSVITTCAQLKLLDQNATLHTLGTKTKQTTHSFLIIINK